MQQQIAQQMATPQLASQIAAPQGFNNNNVVPPVFIFNPATEQTSKSIICPACRGYVNVNDYFCPKCGTQVFNSLRINKKI